MSIIRDNLHTITTSGLTAEQIKQISGDVYLSMDAQISQDEIVDIVQTVRAVKTPFYGTPIPGTFEIAIASNAVIDDSVNIVNPEANQTYQLISISVQNLNPGAATDADIYLTDGSDSVKLAFTGSIAASKTYSVPLYGGPIFFDSDVYLSGVPRSGVALLCQFEVAYAKVVQ